MRVPRRGGAFRVALSAALWLGLGGGLVVGLLLVAGAVAVSYTHLTLPTKRIV